MNIVGGSSQESCAVSRMLKSSSDAVEVGVQEVVVLVWVDFGLAETMNVFLSKI